MVRLGTKCPSITSTCRAFASASTLAMSSARAPKSADSTDGAILTIMPPLGNAECLAMPRSTAPRSSSVFHSASRAPHSSIPDRDAHLPADLHLGAGRRILRYHLALARDRPQEAHPGLHLELRSEERRVGKECRSRW